MPVGESSAGLINTISVTILDKYCYGYNDIVTATVIELNNKEEAHREHLKHHLSHKLKASFLPCGEKEQITRTLGWDTCEALGKIKRSGYVPFALRLKPRVSADRNEVSCVVLCFLSFFKERKGSACLA